MQKAWLAGFLILSLTFSSRRARADSTHEFIMSCTYGVLAGTMIGAASLAFSNKPGDNLNNIARGASIGLYAGILLGLYVVYAVPSEDEQAVQEQTGGQTFYRFKPPSFWLEPHLSPERKFDGATAQFRVSEF